MIFNQSIISEGQNNKFLLKLFHSTVAPGQRIYREHHHTEFEISVFKSGKGIYTVGKKQYDFQKGDVFMFSSDEVHCITKISADEPMDLMNIHFEPRFIWSAGNGMFDVKYLKIFFDRNENFENRLDRDNSATNTIRDILFNIENEFLKKQPEFELMVKVEILRLLVVAIRGYDYVNAHSFSVRLQSLNSLEKAMNYIDKNLSDDITLNSLAKNANMSKTYFCTFFKRLNGISPWDYITIKRIEKAIDLLKAADITMLELALKCGFNNTSNFNRAFKKVTGKTPRDFKL
ncbi:MAG: AraC family transcriptional regulator [Clostridiaceae bacterium]|nr:AraC family transcriptional regulator [Clostridiaceae bacterium]